jgi:hypothetical protein
LYRIEDHFKGGLQPFWEVTEIGTGVVTPSPDTLRLTIQPGSQRYSDAQIADYRYADFHFRWRPPVRMTVTAWTEGGMPSGTAGFGFWNHPFSPDANRFPRLPQAIWFFCAGESSSMAFAYGVPGWGWKAATIDARSGLWALAPLVLPAAVVMRVPPLYARLYPIIQRILKIDERLLDSALLRERHTYTLDWQRDHAVFAVDGRIVLEAPYAPRGPAGFVAWIDNRYAIVTPQGN